MTPAEELKEIADALFEDAYTLNQAIQYKRLLALAVRLETQYALVPKDIADAAAGTVALLGDEKTRKFGNPSPAAKLALRNLAVALGWKDGKS